ncbi:MAG: hypothetical protein ACTSRG_12040 [Candidatus Helarchaeota archaeon]
MSLDEEKDIWRLRKMVKEKDALISEMKENFFNIQKKYAKDIQNLIREKMDLSLELKSLKPSLEKKDKFLEKYSQESIDKIKDLNDKLAKVEKEWEIKYHVVENRCKDLETKYLEDIGEKSREISRLKKLYDDLQKKFNEEKEKNQELISLKAKLDDLERVQLLQVKDPKIAKKIEDLEAIIKNKDGQIYNLKEKLNEANLKIKELSGSSYKIMELSEKEAQVKLIELNNEVKTLKKELAFYQDKKIETIYFGEKHVIECLKDIIRDTKRNIILYVPKFSQLEQLDLLSLPTRIRIQAATSIDPSDENQIVYIDRYRDTENIKIRKYPPADMFAIVSDASTLFIGFIDDNNVPVGFKSIKSSIISFLGGLLKDTYFRFTEEFEI